MYKINNLEQEKYYEFGRAYFGPFLLGFTRWLYNEIKKQEIQKVFFFARDGWMMEQAFHLIVRSNIEEAYVYFSRKSIRQALLHRCKSYEESLKYVSAEKYISFGGLLEYYGFDENERIGIAEKYVRLFSPFYNTDGTREYYVCQQPIYKYSRQEFMHALNNSPWKNGFLKSAFKIPFPYYWIYRMLKK